MKLLTRSMLVGSLGLAAAVVGNPAVAAEPAQAEAAPTPSASTTPQTAKHGYHPDEMAELVGGVLNQLNLTDRQQVAVDTLFRTVAAVTSDWRSASRDLIGELADQVAAGRIDSAKLNPKIEEF